MKSPVKTVTQAIAKATNRARTEKTVQDEIEALPRLMADKQARINALQVEIAAASDETDITAQTVEIARLEAQINATPSQRAALESELRVIEYQRLEKGTAFVFGRLTGSAKRAHEMQRANLIAQATASAYRLMVGVLDEADRDKSAANRHLREMEATGHLTPERKEELTAIVRGLPRYRGGNIIPMEEIEFIRRQVTLDLFKEWGLTEDDYNKVQHMRALIQTG